MNNRLLLIGLSVFSFFAITSCGINSSIMFKEGKDFKGYDSIPMTTKYEYRISPNDQISLIVYTNDGEKIFDILTGATFAQNGSGQNIGRLLTRSNTITYLVRQTGIVDLPIIGETNIAGYTLP